MNYGGTTIRHLQAFTLLLFIAVKMIGNLPADSAAKNQAL
jgi:hypothetical protein